MRSLFVTLLLLTSSLGFSQDGILTSGVVGQAPTIDGTISEGEWAGAAMGEGLVDGNLNTPAPENLQFFLLSDEKYVYAAFKVFDSEPNRIVADEYRRNASLGGEDSITLSLDLFGNLRDFNSFSINPRGANSVNIAGGRAAKTEWLGEIETEARRTEYGWEAEARIPWQLMSLPGAGPRDIRVQVSRYLPRTQIGYDWRYTGAGQSNRVGTWKNVTLPEQNRSRVAQVLAYSVAGQRGGKTIFNNGVDVRTRLYDNFEGVATVNPDFRNIERSILSLDFSYFERLAGDNRPFFQEGRGYFDPPGPLFNSSRIRSLDAAVRVFGTPDDQSRLGVTSVATFGKEVSNIVVASRELNTATSVGAAYVGLRRKNIENDVLSFHYRSSVGPTGYFGRVSTSMDKSRGESSDVYLGLDYGSRGEYRGVYFMRRGANFSARLGSAFETDFKGGGFYAGVERTLRRGPLAETELTVSGEKMLRDNGDPYRQRVELSTSLTWKSGLDLDIDGFLSRFNENDDQLVNMSLEWPRRARTRSWEVGYSFGHLANRPYQQIGSGIRLKPLRTVDVGISTQFVRHFDDEVQLIGSWNWDMGNDLSLNGRVVRTNSDWNGYLSWRRSGGRGNDYFIILGDPSSETFRLSMAAKVVIPFNLRF